MQPVTTEDGVTFIRDDWKSPFWTMTTVFNFLEAAQAKRKIIVIGTISDYRGETATRGLGNVSWASLCDAQLTARDT